MREFKLKSFDNFELYVTLWDDVQNPKGVIQFVHGMSECATHYDQLARAWNERGYIVFADDHRAHGRSEKKENIGRHKGNIFQKTLQDELFIREWLKTKFDLPIFLVGFSYGSFIAQAFAQAGTDVKAIALAGTGYMRGLFTLAQIGLSPFQLVARNWRPHIVTVASDNLFHFAGDEGKMQWLNSDKSRRQEFIDGEYTHVDMSVNFNYYMASQTRKLYSKSNLAKLNPTTAIGIFSGDKDPVGNMGKGVKKLNRMYNSLGIKSELHLYENARHEVFYDKCGVQAIEDVVEFFDKHIVYIQTSIEDIING